MLLLCSDDCTMGPLALQALAEQQVPRMTVIVTLAALPSPYTCCCGCAACTHHSPACGRGRLLSGALHARRDCPCWQGRGTRLCTLLGCWLQRRLQLGKALGQVQAQVQE